MVLLRVVALGVVALRMVALGMVALRMVALGMVARGGGGSGGVRCFLGFTADHRRRERQEGSRRECQLESCQPLCAHVHAHVESFLL